MNTWQILEKERLELAEKLEKLKPEQWDVQSLCSDWKVRDVVAHLILESSYNLPVVAKGLAKAKGRSNKFMSNIAKEIGQSSPSELIEKLRQVASIRRTPLGVKPEEALADFYIHQLDIWLSLGRKKPLTKEQLRYILKVSQSTSLFGAWVVGLNKRIRGLSFTATDVDWSVGRGLRINGPAQSIVLAMSGRKEGLADLSGEGVEILKSRLE